MRQIFKSTSLILLLCCFLTAWESSEVVAQSSNRSSQKSRQAKKSRSKKKKSKRKNLKKPGPHGAVLGKEHITYWKVGVQITARGGNCRGLFATIPIPMEWHEQKVEVVHREISPYVRNIRYRFIDRIHAGVKQLLVTIPNLPAGKTAKAIFVFKVKRNAWEAPADPSKLKIAKRNKIPNSARKHLGQSPYIQTSHPKIRKAALKIKKASKDKSDWEKIEAYYDWIRKNIVYQEGDLKGALAALQDKTGDCEELTSLFIAFCRNAKIPARTVWIPDHCYAEFFMQDKKGNGYWIPCELTGVSKQFGKINTNYPILQKGDNFKVPEKKRKQRYVAEFLKGKTGGGRPNVKFMRVIIPDGGQYKTPD